MRRAAKLGKCQQAQQTNAAAAADQEEKKSFHAGRGRVRAPDQPGNRAAVAKRSRHKFGSKEDFLERERWFVDTCRARAEGGITGGQAPESVKQKARSVLEQWRESLDLIPDFVAGK